MKNFQAIELKKGESIKINGAVITDEIINQLIQIQEHDNELIKSFRDCTAESALLLIESADQYFGINQEMVKAKMIRLATDLGYFRKWFSDLSAPKTDDEQI